jgi:probable 2-oxoglutarate dehydrogenase E1 component DHKTD1
MTHLGLIDDVTSHIATSARCAGADVSLLHNPSHLEIIGSVAAGKARAKSDAYKHNTANNISNSSSSASSKRVLCLQMHGDAAVAGQGCVAEACAMSRLAGFDVGGSIHVVVNNQVSLCLNTIAHSGTMLRIVCA